MLTKEKMNEFVGVLVEGLQWPGSQGVLVTLDENKTINMEIVWEDPVRKSAPETNKYMIKDAEDELRAQEIEEKGSRH